MHSFRKHTFPASQSSPTKMCAGLKFENPVFIVRPEKTPGEGNTKVYAHTFDFIDQFTPRNSRRGRAHAGFYFAYENLRPERVLAGVWLNMNVSWLTNFVILF